MNQEKIGFCEDCGRKNSLMKVAACCGHFLEQKPCCTKQICIDQCVFQCRYCFKFIYEDDIDRDIKFIGYINTFSCPHCGANKCIQFDWYGNSPKKIRNEYILNLLDSKLIDDKTKKLLISNR